MSFAERPIVRLSPGGGIPIHSELAEAEAKRNSERERYLQKYGPTIGMAYDHVVHENFGSSNYIAARTELVRTIAGSVKARYSQEAMDQAILATLDFSLFEARIVAAAAARSVAPARIR